jgi:uncharacterized damage-inducible protein DinB
MIQTKWFERKFAPITDNGLLINIIERLDGTAARLADRISRISDAQNKPVNNGWSIKKEIGHLIDLEPLWFERALQIINNDTELKAADLTNRKTHEIDHDAKRMTDLVAEFSRSRQQLVDVLKNVKDEELDNSLVHPRLGTPMKIIDLAYFVAEHDDHHLVKITELCSFVVIELP